MRGMLSACAYFFAADGSDFAISERDTPPYRACFCISSQRCLIASFLSMLLRAAQPPLLLPLIGPQRLLGARHERRRVSRPRAMRVLQYKSRYDLALCLLGFDARGVSRYAYRAPMARYAFLTFRLITFYERVSSRFKLFIESPAREARGARRRQASSLLRRERFTSRGALVAGTTPHTGATCHFPAYKALLPPSAEAFESFLCRDKAE